MNTPVCLHYVIYWHQSFAKPIATVQQLAICRAASFYSHPNEKGVSPSSPYSFTHPWIKTDQPSDQFLAGVGDRNCRQSGVRVAFDSKCRGLGWAIITDKIQERIGRLAFVERHNFRVNAKQFHEALTISLE